MFLQFVKNAYKIFFFYNPLIGISIHCDNQEKVLQPQSMLAYPQKSILRIVQIDAKNP